MSDPSELLVFCDNVACPLHDSLTTLEAERNVWFGLPDFEQAKNTKVQCHRCKAAPQLREGYLIYVPVSEYTSIGAQQAIDALVGQIHPWQRVPRRENSAVPGATDDTRTYDPDAEPNDRVPVGVVLDVIPYGGYILRYENSDAKIDYGPHHGGFAKQDPKNPDYILQLQDDLIFTCYWNTLRAEPKAPKAAPGVFHYSMIGSILALKEDLSTFYGVPTTTDLDATKTSTSGGTKLSLTALNLPIYYEPGLRNPIFAIFRSVLDPISTCHESALSIASDWKTILGRRKAGKIITKDRAALAKLVERALAARVECDESIKRGHASGSKRAPAATAEVLLGDAQFEMEKSIGKNWKAFESTVIAWDANRTNIGTKINECLSSLHAFEPASDEDPDVVGCYQELLEGYGGLVISLEAALGLGWELLGGIPTILADYSEKLRRYGCVDWATAAYLHAMRYRVPIGGSGAIPRGGGLLAFRLPDEGIDVGVSYDVDALYGMAIDVAKNAEVPPPIVLERFGGESGFEHTFTLSKMAATKAHKNVRLPKMGTDYANWCPAGAAKSTFNFSEMFSLGAGDWDRGEGGRGYSGPLIMSRGWGISQATIGTLVEGVTPKGRADTLDKVQWILGLPVPPDNRHFGLPAFIASTKGGLTDGVGILREKFDSASKRKQACTYIQVGGKEHDCHNCLARFDPDKDFEHVGNTYKLNVDSDRFQQLIGKELLDEEEQLLESPCSWLTAVMRYAGTGDRAFNRLKKTVKAIVTPHGDLAKHIKKATW